MASTLPYLPAALRHLRRDRALAAVIARVGPCRLRPQTDYFTALTRSIVSQMLSTRVADTLHTRLMALVAPAPLTPENLRALKQDQLRGAGLSSAKVATLRELADRIATGQLALHDLGHQDDATITQQLTQIRGIGRWTAEMFLIFALGRPDVWPVGDLGLRHALLHLDGGQAPPTPAAVRTRGDAWKPYRSIATWYLWQSLRADLPARTPARNGARNAR